MKEAIIKSVTAVLCVIALCVTSSVAVGNYSEAVKEAAKLSGVAATDGEVVPDADITPDIYEETTEADTDTSDVVPDDEGETTDVAADEDTTEADKDKDVNDPTKYSTEQVVKYYREVMEKTYKAPKVFIKRTETISINVEEVKPGGKTVAKLANKIIEAYAKTTEYSGTFRNGFDENYPDSPTQNFVFPIQLDPKGAKSASVTKKGNGYEIVVNVKAETATLERFPVYNKQCAFPLDLSTVDLFGIKVTQADFKYPGTVLKVSVNDKGYATYAEVYMPMAGTGGGSFIGVDGKATVSGSLKRTATFTY